MFTADFAARFQIAFPSRAERIVFKGHFVDRRQKRGVAAMVGPIGVDHAQFGHGRIAAFFTEICLAEGEIVCIHGKAHLGAERTKTVCIECDEAVNGRHGFGNVIGHFERINRGKRCFACFHGVDHVMLDALHVLTGESLSVQNVHTRAAHGGTFTLRKDLDALRGRIGTLVKLTGQIFNGKNFAALGIEGFVNQIKLRLGKHRADSLRKKRFVNAFNVIAVKQTDACHARKAEQSSGFFKQSVRFVCKLFFLFNENAIYHGSSLLFKRGKCARTDIAAAVCALKMDLCTFGIGSRNRFAKGIAHRGHAQHAAARRQKLFAVKLCARDVKNAVKISVFYDFKACFIMRRIAVRCQHHAASRTRRELHVLFFERAVRARLHNGKEIAFKKRQNDLGFGIAETAVVFDHARTVLGQHQTEIKASAELSSLFFHGTDGGQEDLLHATFCHLGRIVGVRGNRSHAARIQAAVAVIDALMVH